MPAEPNIRLKLLLEAADWSPSQLAHAMRALATEHGLRLRCDHTTVRRWLDGTQPRPPAPALLLECLSRRLDRRLTAHDAGLTRTPGLVVDLPWHADPVHQLTRLTQTELDPTRRALRHVIAFTPAALILSDLPAAAGRPPDGTQESPPAQRPGQAVVAQTRTMAVLFAAAAERHGGRHVRAALAAYLTYDLIPHLYASGRQQVHCELLSGAAQLALLLGSMCADDGYDGLAQRYHHTAVELAAQADDAVLLTIGLRTMATHAYELGHHGMPAVHLAEQAAARARNTPLITQSYAQAHLAVMQAHHDKHAALAALAHAERLHARADTTPGPFTAYPLGALQYQRAQTLAALGDHAGAASALTASLRARTPAEHRATVLTRARLAETCLRLGRLDEALAHWGAFLDAYPTLTSTRTTRRLTAMRQQLRPHARHQAAADLLARAAALL